MGKTDARLHARTQAPADDMAKGIDADVEWAKAMIDRLVPLYDRAIRGELFASEFFDEYRKAEAECGRSPCDQRDLGMIWNRIQAAHDALPNPTP